MDSFFNLRNNDRYLVCTLSFVLFCILMSCPVFGGSFAAAPGTIAFENMLKSGYAETEIFANNPEDVPVDVEIIAEGQIAEWLSFYPESLVLEPQSTGDSLVIIRPPWDAANGQYEGTITLVSRPRYKQTHDVQYGLNIETAVILKVSAEVVGEQIVDYSVADMSLESVEVGYAVPLTFSGKNDGNVRVTPKISIDVYNSNRSILVSSNNITPESVMPTVKKTETIHIATENLQEGQYWANISVSVFDEIIYTKMITFDILEKGALLLSGEFVQLISNRPWSSPEDIVRFYAIFMNTGEVPATAKFKGEIYLDDVLVDMIESDEMFVEVGGTINLTAYYTPKRTGIYTVEGIVHYSGKSTYTKGTVLNVFSDTQNNNFFVEYKYLITMASVLFLVFFSMKVSGDILGKSKVDMDSTSQKYKKIDTSFDDAARKGERLKRKIRHMKYSRR
ncbi:MAG: hypothetical protein GQ477_00465 [Nanohaloarchaea archaeon]|nr:hypothetical protein [Candidatus Nanohaloarchaea archaeon]